MRRRQQMLVLWMTIVVSAAAQAETWTEIKPGGETRCARGDEYAFYVHVGNPNKVVVDFIGGGACWSADTCAPGSIMFDDKIDALRRHMRNDDLSGIYDKHNALNPVQDWTHIVVPYCTGDIHWGAQDVEYRTRQGNTFTIHHRGATNARAALDWVQANYSAPQKVLVTGCSAGSYGSIFWAPYVREVYKDAQMFQLGDSGAGMLTRPFMHHTFPLWNIYPAAPYWVPGLDPASYDWTQLSATELYNKIAAHYPTTQWAQFNHADDAIQKFFYEQMGGDSSSWASQMQASQEAIAGASSNYNYYIAAGDDHCAIVSRSLYTTNGNDGVGHSVPLVDWVKNYVQE